MPGLHDEGRNRAFRKSTDRNAVKRHRRGTRAAIGGVDIYGVVEHFDWQAGGLGCFLCQHHRCCAGVQDHWNSRAVNMGGDRKISTMTTHDFNVAATARYVTGN